MVRVEWSGVEWNGVECGFGGVHEGSSEGVLREESLSTGLVPSLSALPHDDDKMPSHDRLKFEVAGRGLSRVWVPSRRLQGQVRHESRVRSAPVAPSEQNNNTDVQEHRYSKSRDN